MNHSLRYLCRCKCGKEFRVSAADLRSNGSSGCKSCTKVSHGMHDTSLYRRWALILQRCTNPKNDGWANYGGRGISVYPKWRYFEAFAAWAMDNGYSEDLTIDRIDVDGHYEPSNCRFITPRQNTNNRRNTVHITAFGETKPLGEWLEDPRCVVKKKGALFMRIIDLGWDHEKALTSPTRHRSPSLH